MTAWRDTPLWRRYSRLWGADPVRDIDDELDFHLEMRVRDLEREGLGPAQARERAAAEFGNLTSVRAQMTEIGERRVRNERRTRRTEELLADVRYAVRHFRRTPLSTVTMILVLSLGIGTSVVLFTVLNSLATLPAPGIERDASLVRIRGTMRLRSMDGVQGRLLSWPEVQEYAGRTDLFRDVAAYAYATSVVSTGDEAATSFAAHTVYATSNYFDILGVRPALGSVPAPEADVTQLTVSPGVVISHALWQQHLGGAAGVIGRTLRINDTPVEIVGVAPPRFIGTDGSSSLAVWLPLAAYPLLERRSRAAFLSYDSMFLQAAARTVSDVDAAAITPVAAAIAQRAFRPGQSGASTMLPNGDATNAQGEAGSADVVPMRAMNHRVGGRSELITTSAAASAFALLVLLITCTNVSALMVGLASARRREIGVRLSLGAPRGRLIRQLLTESVLLALVAAAVGLVMTAAGIRLVRATLVNVQLVVDWRVTSATCALAILTGLLFGLSPALHATRAGVGAVLKGAAQSVVGTRSRLQRALVVAQITLTQPLLVGLGVVIVTMITDLGVPTRTAVTERIAEVELVAWAGRATPTEGSARLDALVERVAAMPGVSAAFPMQMGSITMPLTVHTADRVAGIAYDDAMDMSMVAAPAGWFDAFEIPFVRGRDFDAAERAQAAGVPGSATALEREILGFGSVIIGSDLARRLWGSADPIGRRLVFPQSVPTGRAAPSPLVVVGVVDAAAAGPSEVEGNTLRAFVPYAPLNTGVIARTAGPAAPLLDELRRVVTAAAPGMPVWRVQTMAQREAEFRRDVVRMSSAVAGGGLLALLLSAIGLYAVVSFAVGQRTREIGIRTALGARRGQVVRMFFLKGLVLSALGLALGLPLSMMVTRLIVRTLNWPVASPPLIGVAIAAVVLGVASVAAWIPARRASTIDPLAALRTE